MNSPRLKAYGVLAAVFLCGAAAGAGAGYGVAQHRYAELFQGEPRELLQDHRLRGLARTLELDPRQKDDIRRIMANHGMRERDLARTMMQQCGASLRAEKTEMETEIRGTLSPEQQRRYDELMVNQRERYFFRQ